MIGKLSIGVAALALTAPVAAQSMPGMTMPGMAMPAPRKTTSKKPAPKKKAVARKTAPPKRAGLAKGASGHASKQSHPVAAPSHDKAPQTMDMPGMSMPMDQGSASPSTTEPATDHSAMGQGTMPMPAMPGPMTMPAMPGPPATGDAAMPPMTMDRGAMAGMDSGHMAMAGAYGAYSGTREASGTSWQPDTSEHMGVMTSSGGWMLMGHGILNLVYDHQSGPRGDNKAFVSGMLMGMAQHPFGNGTLQFRTMLSPEPPMGPSGYPLLLQTGETANGRDRLIDRQHPHDLFMELSASVSQDIGPKSSVFLYAGLPGEPAFGPPAFMHRESIMDSPEAPITHHWLDSTHITFGVLTAGVVFDRVKLEVSRFNAREPDQHRWDIETGPLDSTALRLSWNPTAEFALQGSWGHFIDPERLEPGVDQARWSASLLYANEVAPGWKLAGTLAWGRKIVQHHDDDAFDAEASLKHASWTIFARGEIIENRELADSAQGLAYRVGKISFGAVRDFRVGKKLSLGAGGLFSVNFVPRLLAPLYGRDNPVGTMAFVRLKLD